MSRAGLDAVLAASDGDDAGGVREGLRAAYVSLLCLRGRSAEAEEVVRAAAESGELRPSCVAMVINRLGSGSGLGLV